jgi:ATP-dependent Clp protease ATP-binding subunit ClpC
MHDYDDAYYHSQHLDLSALRTIHGAEQEALARHQSPVEPEHLLLALVSQQVSAAGHLLQQLGLPPHEVKTQLTPLVASTPTSTPAPASPVPAPTLAPRTQYVIDAAVDESVRIAQRFVGSEHLLLALLREGESPAAKLLQQQGVTYERARAQLYKNLGAP